MNKINIGSEVAGTRIDQFLSQVIENKSRSYVQKLIKDRNVQVNGRIVKPNYTLKEYDTISYKIPSVKVLETLAEDIPLNILYEDDDVIVINKDKGMVVHPGAGNETGTLVNALLHHCKGNLSGINGIERPGIVHRIDKNTSGVLVVAKNDLAHNKLSEQFEDHSIKRIYYAICHNNVSEDRMIIRGPIGRHPQNRKKMSINYKKGKKATTHIKVIERFGKYTLVQAKLETGRTHQIRVHMSSKGFPLLGDDVYGPKKHNLNLKLTGQCLHAKSLGFIHPRTNEYIEFDTELPDEFKKALNKIKNLN